MDADLDTLATALYVKTDDLLPMAPQRAPWRPAIGFTPADLRCGAGDAGGDAGPAGLASESRWLRFTTAHLHHLFPYLPQQPGYTTRLRNLATTISWLIGMLARDTSL